MQQSGDAFDRIDRNRYGAHTGRDLNADGNRRRFGECGCDEDAALRNIDRRDLSDRGGRIAERVALHLIDGPRGRRDHRGRDMSASRNIHGRRHDRPDRRFCLVRYHQNAVDDQTESDREDGHDGDRDIPSIVHLIIFNAGKRVSPSSIQITPPAIATAYGNRVREGGSAVPPGTNAGATRAPTRMTIARNSPVKAATQSAITPPMRAVYASNGRRYGNPKTHAQAAKSFTSPPPSSPSPNGIIPTKSTATPTATDKPKSRQPPNA